MFLQLLIRRESFDGIRNLGSKFQSIEIINDKVFNHPYSVGIRLSSIVMVQ
jgi:hypothetical protein